MNQHLVIFYLCPICKGWSPLCSGRAHSKSLYYHIFPQTTSGITWGADAKIGIFSNKFLTCLILSIRKWRESQARLRAPGWNADLTSCGKKIIWKLLRLRAILRKVWQSYHRIIEPLYFSVCLAQVSNVRKTKGHLPQIVGTRWQLHCWFGFGGIAIPCSYIMRAN